MTSSHSIFESVVHEPLWQLLRCGAGEVELTEQCARRLCDAVFAAVQHIVIQPLDHSGRLCAEHSDGANDSADNVRLRAGLSFLHHVNAALLQPEAYRRNRTDAKIEKPYEEEEEKEEQQPRQKRRTECDSDGVNNKRESITCAEAAAAQLETLFIQFATTVHMYMLSSDFISRTNTASTTPSLGTPAAATQAAAEGAVLPAVVQYALRSCAEGVMALSFALSSHRAPTRSGSSVHKDAGHTAAMRRLSAAVHRLWYAGQFIFVQQLAARGGGDVASYSAFFTDCAARAQKMQADLAPWARPKKPVISGAFTDSESDEDSLDSMGGGNENPHAVVTNHHKSGSHESEVSIIMMASSPLSSSSSSNSTSSGRSDASRNKEGDSHEKVI